MKIYTKKGDKGKTKLYDNTEVEKDYIRVESYGTIDELNSSLGLARNYVEDEKIRNIIFEIQRELFNVAGELATKDREKFPEKIQTADIEKLEKIIDEYLSKMTEKQKSKFIVPGSNTPSAALHISRTICRRAERRIITLSKEEDVSPVLMKYVNRLSDVVYTLARFLETNLEYVNFKNK